MIERKRTWFRIFRFYRREILKSDTVNSFYNVTIITITTNDSVTLLHRVYYFKL